MASNMSDLLEKNLIDYVLKTSNSGNMTAVTSGSIWAGLCTAAPTDTATNECTVASYARKQIPFIAAVSGDAGCIGPSTAVGLRPVHRHRLGRHRRLRPVPGLQRLDRGQPVPRLRGRQPVGERHAQRHRLVRRERDDAQLRLIR